MTYILLSILFFNQAAFACPQGAAAMGKMIDAVADGKAPPKINAKVFSNSADDLGEFTEVLVKGDKLQMYKNGKLVDVDPKDVRTIRAFAKDSSGRRVHAFVASQEKGQEAVSSFFKTVKSGPVSADDAKKMGNSFKAMSEADQATLVGGIENKLRRGQQITEAEFLIAVKGTPGFRTLKGATPHLADLQKAFRSGNLDDSIGILAKSWNVEKASTETQGRVARIAKLLTDNRANRPAQVLTDLGPGVKLPAKLGGAADDIKVPAIRPSTDVAPVRPNTPALVKPGTDVQPRVLTGEVMPRDASVAPFKPRPMLESPVIEGSFTRADDVGLSLRASRTGATPPRVRKPGQLALPEGPRPPKALPAPKPPKPPRQPKVNVLPSDDTVYLVTPKGVVFKPTARTKFIGFLKRNKIKLAAATAGLILAKCAYEEVYDEGCIEYFTSLFTDVDQNRKDKLKGAKIRMKRETKDDGAIACSWSIDLKDESLPEDTDGGQFRPIDGELLQSLSTGTDKIFKFIWTGVHLPETPEEERSTVIDDVHSRTDNPGEPLTCMSDAGAPDNPCELLKPYALNTEVRIQMPAKLVDNEGNTIDENFQCNNQNDDGVTPPNPSTPVPDVTPTPGAEPEPTATPEPTSTPTSDSEDDCETTETDSDLPWYEAERENCEKPPAQRVIDPFNILQGNDGVKQPLIPPTPITVPPSNMPPYVTPGYY